MYGRVSHKNTTTDDNDTNNNNTEQSELAARRRTNNKLSIVKPSTMYNNNIHTATLHSGRSPIPELIAGSLSPHEYMTRSPYSPLSPGYNQYNSSARPHVMSPVPMNSIEHINKVVINRKRKQNESIDITDTPFQNIIVSEPDSGTTTTLTSIIESTFHSSLVAVPIQSIESSMNKRQKTSPMRDAINKVNSVLNDAGISVSPTTSKCIELPATRTASIESIIVPVYIEPRDDNENYISNNKHRATIEYRKYRSRSKSPLRDRSDAHHQLSDELLHTQTIVSHTPRSPLPLNDSTNNKRHSLSLLHPPTITNISPAHQYLNQHLVPQRTSMSPGTPTPNKSPHNITSPAQRRDTPHSTISSTSTSTNTTPTKHNRTPSRTLFPSDAQSPVRINSPSLRNAAMSPRPIKYPHFPKNQQSDRNPLQSPIRITSGIINEQGSSNRRTSKRRTAIRRNVLGVNEAHNKIPAHLNPDKAVPYIVVNESTGRTEWLWKQAQ